MSDDEIIKKIANKFEIINFNERVTKYLLNRFKLKNDSELYNIIKPKLMTITRGEKGATFIVNNNEYNYDLINKGAVIDSTGAGDAFVSSIIKDSIKNDFEYDEDKLKKWYENSNKLTYKVVSKMGARGHINSLFKLSRLKKTVRAMNLNILRENK